MFQRGPNKLKITWGIALVIIAQSLLTPLVDAENAQMNLKIVPTGCEVRQVTIDGQVRDVFVPAGCDTPPTPVGPDAPQKAASSPSVTPSAPVAQQRLPVFSSPLYPSPRTLPEDKQRTVGLQTSPVATAPDPLLAARGRSNLTPIAVGAATLAGLVAVQFIKKALLRRSRLRAKQRNKR